MALSDKLIPLSKGTKMAYAEDVKEFIKKLKEELECEFCKANPTYDGMCSACFNAGIKIDKLAGDKLVNSDIQNKKERTVA